MNNNSNDTNNIKATYITPHISNLINQTNEDQDALINTPSITYDYYYYNDNITSNNHNHERTDSRTIPVQGDDPPQRLMRMPSKNRSLKEIYANSFSQERTTSPPYSPATSSSSSITSYDSDTQQPTFVQEHPPGTTAKSDKQSPFSCLVVFDALENTASSIRRGRPPVTEEYNPDSQLRFVKPTICSVHMSKRKKTEPQNKSASEANTFMASYDDGDMSAGFDTPNKKRGRKPKSQIQGNSFFVLRNPKLAS